ncbi:MAG: CPBP family intramembrane metalloprotease [Bacilli bacterium]|nr:CPBP family intramembrane metalloprotease [Bacilli bacterium]
MFFGKKKCEHCESEYDVVLTTCPACGQEDTNYESTKLPKQVSWMPWWKQLVVFLIGSLGLSIASSIASIPFAMVHGNQTTTSDMLFINLIGYLIAFGAMAALIWPHYKELFKSFKNWLPFVLGIAGCAALYFFSIIYGTFIQAVAPKTTDNANQTLAVQMIKGYPILGILLIGIMGPVCEELTYRVGMFSFGLRMKKWVAYIAVTIVFAFIHFDFGSFGDTNALINELLNLPSYAFAGLVLCFLYDRCGLSARLTAHILNNVISCIFILL